MLTHLRRARARASFLALAAGTIALGLWVHRDGAALGPVAQDVIDDALWAAMMAWWVGAVVPDVRLMSRSAVALGIAVAVEFSQLLHSPVLDAIRRTTLGHLVLGDAFDSRDLAAYLLGVVAAAVLEWTAVGSRARTRDAS